MTRIPVVLLAPRTFSLMAWVKAVASGHFPLPVIEDSDIICASRNADVLPMVLERSGAYANIAFKTQANGRVTDAYLSFVDAGIRFYDSPLTTNIMGALEMHLSFAAMARKGMALERAKGVIAHKQAIGACRERIAGYGWTKIKEVDNNGEAADRVARDPVYAEYVALGPADVAKECELDVLHTAFEDAPAITTFLFIGPPSQVVTAKMNHAILVFRLGDFAGSLYHWLGPLHAADINLKRLHSVDESATTTDFIVEAVVPEEQLGAFAGAVDALRKISQKMTVFGPFPVYELQS